MKFGICNEIFQGWDLAESMRFARSTGYDAIEIAPFTLAQNVCVIPDKRRSEIRRMAEDAGIEISGIHWVLVQTEGLHLTHPDPGTRQKTSDYFCHLADFCADIGGKTIVVGSPKQRNILEGVTLDQAWSWARETFRKSVEVARQRGVTICFEPLAPSETNFINTAADAIRFVSEEPSDHFRIILDVKAMSSESKPIPQVIRESAPHFAYFHANDRNLKGPGFGDVAYEPIVAALRDTGYDGVVSVEVFIFDEGPKAIAERSLSYLKRVFA